MGWILEGFAQKTAFRKQEIYFQYRTNNSNTRHYLARMVRKSKVISRSEFMLDASLKLLFSLSFDSSHLQLLLQSFDIFM